jgi:hypothetical protein
MTILHKLLGLEVIDAKFDDNNILIDFLDDWSLEILFSEDDYTSFAIYGANKDDFFM